MSERKPRLSAQRLVSTALPRVLRERSISTQQRTQRSNSGLRREISLELVARLAPLSATMPSALRSRGISAAGTRQMNHRNPSPSSAAAAAKSLTVDRPTLRNSRREARAGGFAQGAPAAPSSVLDPAVCIYLVHSPRSYRKIRPPGGKGQRQEFAEFASESFRLSGSRYGARWRR